LPEAPTACGTWWWPEPVSKALAASLTLAMLAWLPVEAVWSLMDGWAQLVSEVDRATSYAQIDQGSGRFRKVISNEIPLKDPVGDRLVEAAVRYRNQWSACFGDNGWRFG
jgi:hypothetical protein